MPVDFSFKDKKILYQREQYQKGGLGRTYRDYRDKIAISFLDNNDKVIADIGCGEGITLERIKQKWPGSEVFGIDIIDENIATCWAHNLDARKGDIYNLSGIRVESIDAVIFMDVIEHLDRPHLALKEICRILKKGGKIILTYPNDTIFKMARILTLRFKEAFYDAGHKRQWKPAEMRDFIDSHGFDIAAVRNMPFSFWCISLNGLIVGRKK